MEHKLQGIRSKYQDYREPSFYMVTMATWQRMPLLAACHDNASFPTEDGRLVEALWRDIPRTYPQVEVSTFVLMPDHFHGIVHVKERMEKPLGVPLRAFKSQATGAIRRHRGNETMEVWTPGYHDLCVWRRGSLAAYTKYIRDNPRRYCMKKTDPQLFSSTNNLRHERLPASETWTGYGNLFLLDKPEMLSVRVSRRASEAEIADIRQNAMREASRGAVVVSPFISPGEKEVATAVLEGSAGAVILMKPDGFGEYFKPHGRYFDLCAQGRLLILACRPPVEVKTPLTREMCLNMNAWCGAIAEDEVRDRL